MADKGKGKGKAPAAAPAPTPAPAPASHSKAPQTAKQPKAEKSNAKRVARPDDEKYEKDQAALDAKIKELQERQAALRERISGADGTSAGGSRRKELQEEKSKYLASSRILKDEREKILRQFEDVRKVREAKLKDLDDLRARAGPHKTQEKIDQVIKEMEVKIESGSLKLIEEKKLVTEIGNLKKSKKTLEVYDKQAQDLEADKKNYEALKEKLDAKSEEQRKNFEKVKEIEAKLDALKKEQEDDKAKLNQLIEDRNTTSQHIRELFDKKRELFESMRKQRDEYRVFQQEEIIKRKEAQRLEREQFAEERRKALEEKRREERMTPKFVDEITSASNLIFFLQSTYKNEEKAQATEEEKKAAVEIKGMVALKSKSDRLDDDVFYSAKGKAQKEKRPAQKVLKKTDSIKLPLVAIEQFAQLSVPIPSTVNDVDQTLQLLEEKKKHFEQRQKEELEKAKAEEEAEKAAEKEAALKAEQEASKPKEEAKQEPAEEAKEEEVAEEAKEEVAEEAKDDEAKANEEAS